MPVRKNESSDLKQLKLSINYVDDKIRAVLLIASGNEGFDIRITSPFRAQTVAYILNHNGFDVYIDGETPSLVRCGADNRAIVFFDTPLEIEAMVEAVSGYDKALFLIDIEENVTMDREFLRVYPKPGLKDFFGLRNPEYRNLWRDKLLSLELMKKFLYVDKSRKAIIKEFFEEAGDLCLEFGNYRGNKRDFFMEGLTDKLLDFFGLYRKPLELDLLKRIALGLSANYSSFAGYGLIRGTGWSKCLDAIRTLLNEGKVCVSYDNGNVKLFLR